MKTKLVAFDFDGTITRGDSFIRFVRYSRGDLFFCRALACNLPWLVAYKLGVYANGRAKERLFAYCYRGVSLRRFNAWCRGFAEQVEQMVRPEVVEMIGAYRAEGAVVLIVSASIANWITPWADGAGIHSVLATEPEVDASGILTGRFLTPNCYGPEKTRRILAAYPDRPSYTLIAYGDSHGDDDMLGVADEGWIRKDSITFGLTQK